MIPFMHEHIGPADKVCPRCEIDRERRPSRQPRGAPEPHFTEIRCPSCKDINSRYCRACDGMGTTYVRTDALDRFPNDLKFTAPCPHPYAAKDGVHCDDCGIDVEFVDD